ncbi:MAG: formylglycine-generating enzyme family protein [Proteobacteria bacterium]|jgi:formylglycine-generating enzyme required for sulfatase activity|nr:formylglycine-generating enzyme family protein [Pseudomonadota bacterium]
MPKAHIFSLMLALLSGASTACSCEEKSEGKHDSGTGVPDGSDGDTDSDSDSDTDSDSNTDPADPEIDWVEIPAGNFIFGSPVGTPCRGPGHEKEVPVILTHPFLMSKYEVTQRQWTALGFEAPHNAPFCEDCPVTFIDQFEAMAWCNALSAFESLEECYDLSSCSGTIGSGCPDGDFFLGGCAVEEGTGDPLPDVYRCASPVRKHVSMYDCAGYRLPTGPEWEYAAKAGTTTNTYNGDITVDSEGICIDEPILNDIAWYCDNSGFGNTDWTVEKYDLLREVGFKQPSPFELYDMLGNAWEWVDYVSTGGGIDWIYGGTGETLTDPMGPGETDDVRRDIRGGAYNTHACRTRAAHQFEAHGDERHAVSGFRPVRTLPSTAPDTGPGDSGVK